MFAVDSVIYESEQNYVGLSNGFTLSNRADPDRFVQPSKIIFDKQDNLYLVDRGNQRIQKFTVGSKVASTIFSNPSINCPCPNVALNGSLPSVRDVSKIEPSSNFPV